MDGDLRITLRFLHSAYGSPDNFRENGAACKPRPDDSSWPEHLAAAHPPGRADLDRVVGHYAKLAAMTGDQIGRSAGAIAIDLDKGASALAGGISDPRERRFDQLTARRAPIRQISG